MNSKRQEKMFEGVRHDLDKFIFRVQAVEERTTNKWIRNKHVDSIGLNCLAASAVTVLEEVRTLQQHLRQPTKNTMTPTCASLSGAPLNQNKSRLDIGDQVVAKLVRRCVMNNGDAV